MPINDEELLAAISGGVDNATPSAPVETTQETNDDNTDDADDSADDGSEGGADGDAVEGGDEQTGEPDANGEDGGEGTGDDAEGEELGPDGKPVAKAGAKDGQAEDEIDPATGKPYTPEQIEARKKEKERDEFRKQQVEDPINAPIPKYLKETTQKRMTKLVEIAKDLTAKHESAQRDRNEILGMITDTGATATQYTQALQYLKMVNSRDPAQIRQAIQVMQEELAALSRMAGVPVTGVDLLADHKDLQDAVKANQITQQLAEEIAAGRNQRAHQTQVTQLTQEQQQAAQQEHAAGVQALNQIGRELAARDPNYRAKAQAVLKQIQGEMQKQRPSQWAQTFLVAYTTYQPPRAPAPTPTPAVRKVPKNQPLRGNNPSGGVAAAPKSLEEAINMGIAAGTRR